MNANRTPHLMVVLAVMLSFGFSGCAAKPFEPPQTGEIPKGPGIMSKGDDGFVLYDSKKNKAQNNTKKSPDGTPQAGTSPADDPAAAADYEEFEAYKQFKAWKKSAAGTKEYEEFEQWRQWQQYREWKRKN